MSGVVITSFKYRFMNIIVKAHGVLLVLSIIVSSLVDPDEELDIGWFIYQLRGIMNSIFSIIVIIFLWRSKPELCKIMSNINPFLKEEDHLHLRRLSFVLLLHKIFSLLTFKFSYVIFKIIAGFTIPGYPSSPFYILLIYKYIHSWQLITFALMLVLVKAIHAAERNQVSQMIRMQRKQKQATPTDSVSVYLEVKKIVNVKEQFMKTISILPCLYFFDLFARSISALLRYQLVLRDNDEEDFLFEFVFAKVNLVHFVVISIQMIYLTHVFDSLAEESRINLESLATSIIVTPGIDRKEWLFALEQIREATRFEYKVAGFFVINKRILLSFLASLVSFTVLILQLISQVT